MSTIKNGPSVSNALNALNKDFYNSWIDFTNKYGKNFFYGKALFCADAEWVDYFLMSRPHTQFRSNTYKFLSGFIPGAPGILFKEGEPWQKTLKATMPVFTKANIDQYIQFIFKKSESFFNDLSSSNSGNNDLFDDISNLGISLIAPLGFGLDLNIKEHQKIMNILKEYKLTTMNTDVRLDGFGFDPKILFKLFKIIKFRNKLKKQVNDLKTTLNQIINSGYFNDSSFKNWVNLLLESDFDLDELTNEINHIYGAYTAIDYIVFMGIIELSKHPEWLTKLKNEASIAQSPDFILSRENLSQFPHLKAFMNEVLRYYPVAIAVGRKLGEDLVMGNTQIKKGTEVILSIQTLHHHPDYWENPKEFNPARWINPKHEPKAFIPFLDGPRQCIGKHLAEIHFIGVFLAYLNSNPIIPDYSKLKIGNYMIPRPMFKVPYKFDFK